MAIRLESGPGGTPESGATVFRVEGARQVYRGDGPTLDLFGPWEALPRRGSATSVVLESFTNDLPLLALRRFLHRATWLLPAGGAWEAVARDPDFARAELADPPWPGERIEIAGTSEIFRPFRHYLELARLFPCELGVPRALDQDRGLLRLRGIRTVEAPEPTPRSSTIEEKYGVDSSYRRFDRLEEPEILDDLLYALARLLRGRPERVLGIGVNDGRELALLDEVASEGMHPPERWGIDASESAIAAARRRFPAEAEHFFALDLARISELELPRFGGVLILGVLQCTTVDRDRLLEELRPLLAPVCHLLISIPNCHFGDHDILRRPLRRDDPRHDRSLVAKDLRYLTRWCHRAGFDSTEIFGTYDAFLLARRLG